MKDGVIFRKIPIDHIFPGRSAIQAQLRNYLVLECWQKVINSIQLWQQYILTMKLFIFAGTAVIISIWNRNSEKMIVSH